MNEDFPRRHSRLQHSLLHMEDIEAPDYVEEAELTDRLEPILKRLEKLEKLAGASPKPRDEPLSPLSPPANRPFLAAGEFTRGKLASPYQDELRMDASPDEPFCSLCPKGYAWCREDCDFGQDCKSCSLDASPTSSERTK